MVLLLVPKNVFSSVSGFSAVAEMPGDIPARPRRSGRRRCRRPPARGLSRNSRSLKTNASRPRDASPATSSCIVRRSVPARRAASVGRSCCAMPRAARSTATGSSAVVRQIANRPFKRHVGRDAEERQHHQRLQASCADAHQRLAAAARSKRHADAEKQAADEIRQPDEVRAHVIGFRQVDLPGQLQGVGADDRHRDRQEPHAHASPIAPC